VSGPHLEIVIIGITSTGRPSSQRLGRALMRCMSLFGRNQAHQYSPYLKPVHLPQASSVWSSTDPARVESGSLQFSHVSPATNELQGTRGRHEVRRAIQLRHRLPELPAQNEGPQRCRGPFIYFGVFFADQAIALIAAASRLF